LRYLYTSDFFLFFLPSFAFRSLPQPSVAFRSLHWNGTKEGVFGGKRRVGGGQKG
jgi:hypothetical protein